MQPLIRALAAIGRWLRTWPQPRFRWPMPANLAERERLGLTDAPAQLRPTRLLGETAELEIRNAGDGAATEIEASVYLVQRPQPTTTRSASLNVLGSHARYIVDLERAALPATGIPDGVWIHLRWLDHDGSEAECWSRADAPAGAAFEDVASPLA